MSIIEDWAQKVCWLLHWRSFSLDEFLLILTCLLLWLTGNSTRLLLDAKVITDHYNFIACYFHNHRLVTWNKYIVWAQTIKYRSIYISKIMLCRPKLVNFFASRDVPNDNNVFMLDGNTNKSSIYWPINIWNLCLTIQLIFWLDVHANLLLLLKVLSLPTSWIISFRSKCWLVEYLLVLVKWLCADLYWVCMFITLSRLISHISHLIWLLGPWLVLEVIVVVGQVHLAIRHELVTVDVDLKQSRLCLLLWQVSVQVYVEVPHNLFRNDVKNEHDSVFAADCYETALMIEFYDLCINFLK